MKKQRLNPDFQEVQIDATPTSRRGAKGGGGGGSSVRGRIPPQYARGVWGTVACGGCHGRWSDRNRNVARLMGSVAIAGFASSISHPAIGGPLGVAINEMTRSR